MSNWSALTMFNFPLSLEELLDWATNPDGIGLPILIGIALGILLYFMRTSEKDWHESEKKIEEHQERRRNIGYPDKPF